MGTTRIPWLLLAAILVVAGVGWGQGWRTAASLQDHRTPSRTRVVEVASSLETVEIPRSEALVAIDLGPARPQRLALYQILPERKILRWVEAAAHDDQPLLFLPLEGLPEGRFWLCAVGGEIQAGPSEMDRPEAEFDPRLELRIVP